MNRTHADDERTARQPYANRRAPHPAVAVAMAAAPFAVAYAVTHPAVAVAAVTVATVLVVTRGRP